MRCPQCRQDNPTRSRFCNGCGSKLDRDEVSSIGGALDTQDLRTAKALLDEVG